jgi:hypothetical protein
MKLKPTLKQKKLQQITARDFGGGLNYADSEFNVSTRYAVEQYNTVPDDNNAMQVRWGTRKFADFGTVLRGRIVAVEYYFSYVIAVDTNGEVAACDGSGIVVLIWSNTIAATLSGSPAGWSSGLTRANFTQYLGDLIIVNGVDKPITVNNLLNVAYLQDLGSGSNIHVPITKMVVTHSNYVVMAGDPANPGRLHISNAGTSGTWVGDALPNDAITFDVDKYVPDSTGEITSITSYRDKLVVFFAEYIVAIKLGAYSTATPPVHTPTVDDLIESYGSVSDKTVVNAGDFLLFLDFTGVSQIKNATFTNQLQPSRVSTLIDIAIVGALAGKSKTFLQDNCFAVYDKRESRVIFFIPASTALDSQPAPALSVYCASIRKGGIAWSRFVGWPFQSGTVSTEGRVFLAIRQTLYRYGNKNEPILSDFEGVVSYQGPPEDKVSTIVNGVFCDASFLGLGIPFYHELPHTELKDRTNYKTLHYMSFDSDGASSFSVDLIVDDMKFRYDTVGDRWSDSTLFTDGTGWLTASVVPYATMSFVGGRRGAYNIGLPTPAVPTRPAGDMRLYAVYGRFRFLKLVFYGTSYSHLRIVSASLYYTMGSIY